MPVCPISCARLSHLIFLHHPLREDLSLSVVFALTAHISIVCVVSLLSNVPFFLLFTHVEKYSPPLSASALLRLTSGLLSLGTRSLHVQTFQITGVLVFVPFESEQCLEGVQVRPEVMSLEKERS